MTHPHQTYTTHIGRVVEGDNLFCGHSVRDELAGSIGLWGALSMAIGGPPLNTSHIKLLDTLVSCSLAADPRIWPLKLPRVVGAYGSMWSALASSLLLTDSALVGPGPSQEAAEYLQRLKLLRDAHPDLSAEALIDLSAQEGRLFGFGLPGRASDERFDALLHWMTHHAPQDLHTAHWDLLREVRPVILQKYGLAANIVTGIAATLLDVGFKPQHIVVMTTIIALPCFMGNAYEGALITTARCDERLHSAHVRYVGEPPRDSSVESKPR